MWSVLVLQSVLLISLHIHPSILQYSVFGSIMTIGGMVGAVISGKLADVIGRKYVSFLHDQIIICRTSVECF